MAGLTLNQVHHFNRWLDKMKNTFDLMAKNFIKILAIAKH